MATDELEPLSHADWCEMLEHTSRMADRQVNWGRHLLIDYGPLPIDLRRYTVVPTSEALMWIHDALYEASPVFLNGITELYRRTGHPSLVPGRTVAADDSRLMAWIRKGFDPFCHETLTLLKERPAPPNPVVKRRVEERLKELAPPPPPLHDFEFEVYDQDKLGYGNIPVTLVDSEETTFNRKLDQNGYSFLMQMQPGTGKAQVPKPELHESFEEEQLLDLVLRYENGSLPGPTGYALTSADGTVIDGVLSPMGRAKLTWRGSPSSKVVFPDLRTTTPELNSGVVVEAGTPVELSAKRPPLCNRLVGFLFDTDKSFLLPGALPVMAQVCGDFKAYPKHEVWVVGHTDTVGRPSYNQTLSEERASAMVAFLQDDVAAWLAWFDEANPGSKRWGQREQLLMLGTMPDASGKGDDESPVLWYQRTRGLEETGIADDAFRNALIAEYMAADGTTLPDDATLQTRGDGEEDPLIESGDDQEEPRNRRVEIFFDEPGKPAPKSPKLKKKRDKKPKTDETEVQELPVPAPSVEGALAVLRLIDSEGDNMSQQRQVEQEGILEVVPPQGKKSTRIEVITESRGAPFSAISWTSTGGGQPVSGESALLVECPPGEGWNPNANPKTYGVIAEMEDVNVLQARVHAFPNDRFEIGADFDEPAEWKDVVEAIETALDILGNDVTIIKPKGEWKLKSAWREAENDPRAFYWFNLVGKMDPLFGFDDVEITLGPDKVLKWLRKIAKRIPGKLGKKIEKFIKKSVQVNAFVKLSGSVALDIDMERTGPEQSLEAVENKGRGIVGSPTVEIGLQAKLGDDPDDDDDDPILSLVLKGSTNLHFDVQPFVTDSSVSVELVVRMDDIFLHGDAQLLSLDLDTIKIPLFESSDKSVYGPKKLTIYTFNK